MTEHFREVLLDIFCITALMAYEIYRGSKKVLDGHVALDFPSQYKSVEMSLMNNLEGYT